MAMNSVATRVIENKMKLLGEQPVYINQHDIDEICDRCDTHKERLVALGVLCYAKAYRNTKGEFKLSQVAMCNWLGINNRTLVKYLDLLVELKYIQKVGTGEVKSWYQTTVVTTLNKYRILVDTDNSGEYILQNNDIHTLYDEIFNGVNTCDETWFNIPNYHNWYQVSTLGRVRVCERIIGERIYPAKIVRLFKSKSGKDYANLVGDDGKQKKISIEKLLQMASR